MFSWWSTIDTWMVVVAAMCAVACALLGNFLVLRRMSMMGDAISHAVLPGLVIAFMLSGSRASLPMFAGAAVVGVLTAVFTEWVRSFGKVDEGASMGVVFTALFAVGLILIVQVADRIDLDPTCVLYGALELVGTGESVRLFGWEAPSAFVTLGIVLVIDVVAIVVLFKEFRISAFDPALATTLGVNARFMHYLLMVLVAMTTVASFEVVGSILVVAMLIVPAAAAHLLTERLSSMIIVSVVIAIASAVLGHVGAVEIPRAFGFASTQTAGVMALAAGLIFLGALLLAPRHGVVSRAIHRAALTLRITREDILGTLYRVEEQSQPGAQLPVDRLRHFIFTPPMLLWMALRSLQRKESVVLQPGGYQLTESGRTRAQELLRSHRLWESYFVSKMDVRPDHTHRSAEQLEHVTTAAVRRQLRGTLGDGHDPQGRPIPPAE